MSYKDADDKYSITYSLVYKWTRAYIDKGPTALKYQKREPKLNSEIYERKLTEVENVKGFFGTLKTEMYYEKKFKTLEKLSEKIVGYINFYNKKDLRKD